MRVGALFKIEQDITGARWGLDTAQAILTLRAIATTGDFAQYRTA